MSRMAVVLLTMGLCLAYSGIDRAAKCSGGKQVLATLAIGVPPWLSGPASAVWVRNLGEHLEKDACLSVSFAGDADYPAYFRSALAGKYDALIVPAHLGVLLVKKHGFSVAAYENGSDASMVLFVRSDSSITTVQQLSGRTVALPDPLALATLLVEHRFAAEKIPVRFAYYPRHEHVVAAVGSGQASAGGVYSPVLGGATRSKEKWRLLLTLLPPGTPNGMAVERPGLDPAVRERLSQSLLRFDPGPSAFLPQFDPISPQEEDALAKTIAPFVELFERRLTSAETASESSH